MKDELVELYKKWSEELKIKCPKLISEKYSNPYYVSIPENWESSENRVMIVGQEGFGNYSSGVDAGWNIDNIKDIQERNRSIVDKILKAGKDSRRFWARFIKIAQLNCSYVWNNFDKIHSLWTRSGLKYALTADEEKQLHSTDIKILKNEIDVLKANIIVFCYRDGYSEALKSELPQIHEMLYSNSENYKRWKENRLCVIEKDDIKYVFAGHPNWKTKEYEQEVIDCVKSCMK